MSAFPMVPFMVLGSLTLQTLPVWSGANTHIPLILVCWWLSWIYLWAQIPFLIFTRMSHRWLKPEFNPPPLLHWSDSSLLPQSLSISLSDWHTIHWRPKLKDFSVSLSCVHRARHQVPKSPADHVFYLSSPLHSYWLCKSHHFYLHTKMGIIPHWFPSQLAGLWPPSPLQNLPNKQNWCGTKSLNSSSRGSKIEPSS